jgi:transcriptional regulator with XRE-family HTH domain
MTEITLATWMQDQLKRAGITQNELARRTGLASSTLSAIRHGQRPNPQTVMALADYFGADRQAVLEIAGIIGPVGEDIPPEARDFLRRLYGLREEDRAGAMRLIEELLSFVESRVSATRQKPESDQQGSGLGTPDIPKQ